MCHTLGELHANDEGETLGNCAPFDKNRWWPLFRTPVTFVAANECTYQTDSVRFSQNLRWWGFEFGCLRTRMFLNFDTIHPSLLPSTSIMDPDPLLWVSVTPSVASFTSCFENLVVKQTPELSANDALTINCDHRKCQKLISRAAVTKITAQGSGSMAKVMLVCHSCYCHYKVKPSTTTINCKFVFSLADATLMPSFSELRSVSTTTERQIHQDVAASQRGGCKLVFLLLLTQTT